MTSPSLLVGEEALVTPFLHAADLLALARTSRAEWTRALEVVRGRFLSTTSKVHTWGWSSDESGGGQGDAKGNGIVVTAGVSTAPFVLKSENQKSAALRFLPLWEQALLFENFHDEELGCHWHNYRSSGALRRWSFRKSEATGAIQWSE
eukprot:g1924.t2